MFIILVFLQAKAFAMHDFLDHLGMKDKKCFFVQAKVVGGGTTINGGLYARGHPEDFNRWAEVYGNPGWSYEEVLPYFKKSENAVFVPRDINYHGTGGYFTVDQAIEPLGLQPVIINGFKELGVDSVVDYNGKRQIGVSKYQYALNGNERVSTSRAFLEKFNTRTNLKISLNSFVTKILFNGNNEAYGVEFVKNGYKYIAKAKKEVILSAGAINSAQLLLLSGIGPEKHLKELGIPIRQNLPVGQNLQDHVIFLGFNYRTKNIFYNLTLVEQLELYLKNLGPLVTGPPNEMIGFTNFGPDQKKRPEIEYMFYIPTVSGEQMKVYFGLNDEYAAAHKANAFSDIMVLVVLLHPKSRGTVTLKSRNPEEKPIIDPNFLSKEEEIETIYKGIQYLIDLGQTEAFKNYGAELVTFDYPSCECFEKLTKEWWKCVIRHLSTSSYHPVATNKMGPDPKTSVVNARLQVHGIKRLRVADGSILPELNSGHTMTPIMMVGEKAADMIKEDHGVYVSIN